MDDAPAHILMAVSFLSWPCPCPCPCRFPLSGMRAKCCVPTPQPPPCLWLRMGSASSQDAVSVAWVRDLLKKDLHELVERDQRSPTPARMPACLALSSSLPVRLPACLCGARKRTEGMRILQPLLLPLSAHKLQTLTKPIRLACSSCSLQQPLCLFFDIGSRAHKPDLAELHHSHVL